MSFFTELSCVYLLFILDNENTEFNSNTHNKIITTAHDSYTSHQKTLNTLLKFQSNDTYFFLKRLWRSDTSPLRLPLIMRPTPYSHRCIFKSRYTVISELFHMASGRIFVTLLVSKTWQRYSLDGLMGESIWEKNSILFVNRLKKRRLSILPVCIQYYILFLF